MVYTRTWFWSNQSYKPSHSSPNVEEEQTLHFETNTTLIHTVFLETLGNRRWDAVHFALEATFREICHQEGRVNTSLKHERHKELVGGINPSTLIVHAVKRTLCMMVPHKNGKENTFHSMGRKIHKSRIFVSLKDNIIFFFALIVHAGMHMLISQNERGAHKDVSHEHGKTFRTRPLIM